jgi:hypothetical protein
MSDLPVACGVHHRNNQLVKKKRVTTIIPPPPHTMLREGLLKFLAPLVLQINRGHEHMDDSTSSQGGTDRHHPHPGLASARNRFHNATMALPLPRIQCPSLPSVKRDWLGDWRRRHHRPWRLLGWLTAK